MIKIKNLDWDSKFFGFSVGALALDDPRLDVSQLRSVLRQSTVRVCYIIGREIPAASLDLLERMGALRMPDKVVFEKSLAIRHNHPASANIRSFHGGMTDKLVRLAYTCGQCSRFKRDPGFAPQYERLYRHWMDASLKREIADEVFVAGPDGRTGGVITCSFKNGAGTVGLLAVDEEFRGQRVGTQLLGAAEQYFHANGVDRVQITTQGDNLPAGKFYEKNGYSICRRETFYHYWGKPA